LFPDNCTELTSEVTTMPSDWQ